MHFILRNNRKHHNTRYTYVQHITSHVNIYIHYIYLIQIYSIPPFVLIIYIKIHKPVTNFNPERKE